MGITRRAEATIGVRWRPGAAGALIADAPVGHVVCTGLYHDILARC